MWSHNVDLDGHVGNKGGTYGAYTVAEWTRQCVDDIEDGIHDNVNKSIAYKLGPHDSSMPYSWWLHVTFIISLPHDGHSIDVFSTVVLI